MLSIDARSPGGEPRADSATGEESVLEATRLTHAVTVAEERTRASIAAGLHDDVGQLLSLARLRLRALSAHAPDAELASLVSGVDELVAEAARRVRVVTYELTSPVLQQLGLAAAIESLGPQMQADGGPRFQFHSEGSVTLGRDVSGVLFRIARELLLNVRKHARAASVFVEVVGGASDVRIVVRDDGVGCAVDPADATCTPAGGYGLFSGHAQMRGLGGTLRLHSPPDGGTQVTIHLPVPR